jgi:3-phenylpropionate/trans-cinnamate dioxygenase ferredoxin reductase component
MPRATHVIVGASLAGASAAAALRKEGFDGRIVLIGEEPEVPYERPELSKKYLRGEPDTDIAVHEAGFYEAAGIELLIGAKVDSIDVGGRAVTSGSTRIGFDRLLLATGATPKRPAIPGADLENVLTLRTRHDADTIRERAAASESIAVVGGGWIGSEVAASLRQLGHDVSLLTPTRTPLERVLGPEVGEVYRAAHERAGVRLVTGTIATSFEGNERVTRVRTKEGRTISADLVVVGIGTSPRTELAEAAGLAMDDGVLADERLETSVPGIFAAGDVATAWHPHYERRLRVEHWDNAKRQGRAAAANMLGRAAAYDRIPYFYSDQYDLGMEYAGFAPEWDRVVFRGDPAGREFVAFWLAGDRVVAGMNLNVWDVQPAIERLIQSGAPVDAAQLSDAARPLTELTSAA